MKIDIWFLFEIGINLYQAVLITYFVRQRFHLVRPQFAYGVLCTLAIWAYLTLISVCGHAYIGYLYYSDSTGLRAPCQR